MKLIEFLLVRMDRLDRVQGLLFSHLNVRAELLLLLSKLSLYLLLSYIFLVLSLLLAHHIPASLRVRALILLLRVLSPVLIALRVRLRKSRVSMLLHLILRALELRPLLILLLVVLLPLKLVLSLLRENLR